MSEPTITLQNITKQYKLYDSPADRLKESLFWFCKKRHKLFTALNDVSFSLYEGDFIGIIGRNGSGKSTLLKLLTGIVNPTSGLLEVNGKISALLELGAGFNPEMTGLENIYFAGTFMGHTKAALDAKIDDIIAFADIGEYINQPVKLYSSGMFVRVAFSLAINVDPEIFLVDEALSVGDIRFQQKCLRRIQTFKEQGKTILLVSHDLGGVQNFCDKVIWLEQGSIREFGNARDVVKNYRSFMSYDQIGSQQKAISSDSPRTPEGINNIPWEDLSKCSSFGEKNAEITGIYLHNDTMNCKADVLMGGELLRLSILIQTHRAIVQPIIGFTVNDKFGNPILGTHTEVRNCDLPDFSTNQTCMVTIDFPFPRLANGHYQLCVALANGTHHNHEQEHWIHDAAILHVDNPNPEAGLGILFIMDDVNITVHT